MSHYTSPSQSSTILIDKLDYNLDSAQQSMEGTNVLDEHLCALDNCRRKGTRLVSSLRYDYRLKPHGSNRVCEGHYRKDLRKFKKEHGEKAQLVNHRKDKRSSPCSLGKPLEPCLDSVALSSEMDFDIDVEVPTMSCRKRKRSTSPQQIDEVMTDERMHSIEKYAHRILLQMKKDDPIGLGSISTYNSQSDDELDHRSRISSSKVFDMHTFDTPLKRRRVY